MTSFEIAQYLMLAAIFGVYGFAGAGVVQVLYTALRDRKVSQ